MLNQEKIEAMTKAAIYESRGGKEDIQINEYSGSDYVRYNMLKTLIGVTFAFIFICGIYLIYTSNNLFQSILNINLVSLGKLLLLIYILTIAAYIIICVVFYQYKYSKAVKRIKTYELLLKRIQKLSNKAADGSLGGKTSVD